MISLPALFIMKVKNFNLLFHVLLGVAFYVMPFSHVDAQNKVSVSFEKKSIDYQNKIICYDLLLTNTGNADWNLSGQNYRLYYNSLDISIIPDSLISYLDMSDYSGLVVVQSLEDLDAGFVDGNLPYEDNLGFLNCFIDLVDVNNGGVIVPVNNSLSVAQLCFAIELSDPDEFCFELDCAEDPTTMGYANAFINISEWINMNTQTSLDIDLLTGIVNTNTDVSCVDFIENDIISCTDGLDNDEDGFIDCMDFSCNAIDIYCEGSLSSCGDGIDNDGDGDIDCDDMDCGIPMILSIEITEITNCPEENNGSITVIADQSNFEYSIDGGISYQMGSTFSDLIMGDYMISVRNTSTGCIANLDSIVNILDLDCPTIIEDCGDGVDNDGDGDIDCDDMECIDFCDQFEIFMPNCFSPLKRDNTNDNFLIHCANPNEFSAYDFFIYDRWGSLVKEGNGLLIEGENVLWDGNFRNQLVDSGVYIFHMRVFHDNETIRYKSSITVF